LPSNSEKEFLLELLEAGKPEACRFVPKIEEVRVSVECTFGCDRIYFVSEPSDKMMILASRLFDRPDGGSIHCYVFAVGESLAGLKVTNYNRPGELEEFQEEAILLKAHLSKYRSGDD